MKISSSATTKMPFYTILRVSILIFMCMQFSIGHISEYFDHFETNEIEFAEERDMESEEKEGKEEIEKNTFVNRMHSFIFSNIPELQLRYSLLSNLDSSLEEVPTPPPRKLMV